MIERLVKDSGGHVRDEREAKDLDAHVAGDDDLMNSGHANEVGTEGAEGSDLGVSLEAGAKDSEVDTFGEREALRSSGLDGKSAEAWCVGGAHVEEALACGGGKGEAWLVGAESGVGAGEVDMVVDGDQLPYGERGPDASGGVGDDERGTAKEAEDARGEDDVGDGVALVGVDAALHDGDRDAADAAQDELAGVADDGGLREVRDLGIGDGDGVVDLVGKLAEAGAEDNAECRGETRL